MGGEAQATEELTLGALHDRALAFLIDAVGFTALRILWLRASDLSVRWAIPFQDPRSYAPWLLAFLGYQALGGPLGTLGLGFLGLRLVDHEGRPLTFGRSLIRAAALPFSVLVPLGSLWSIFDPLSRCWHDVAAGSLCVRAPRASPAFGRLLGTACIAGGIAILWWKNAVLPRYYALISVRSAQVGLLKVSRLENDYYRRNGAFSESLESLTALDRDPPRLRRNLAAVFAPGSLAISVSTAGYSLSARATDLGRTPLAWTGP